MVTYNIDDLLHFNFIYVLINVSFHIHNCMTNLNITKSFMHEFVSFHGP